MLLLDDSAKQILEENGIPFGEYTGPEDIYLSFVLNVALDTAMKYNDADPNNQEEAAKYVRFIKESDALSKCLVKMDKLSHDILNIICDTTEGEHKQIMKIDLNAPKEEA